MVITNNIDNKKKVCLIQPPLFNIIKEFIPPLGLAYIAAYLGRNGYEVTLIDANADKKDNDTLVQEVVFGEFEIIGITVVTIAVPIVIDLASRIKKVNPGVKIIVGGIHSTVAYESLFRMCPDIDIAVIGEGEVTFLEIIRLYEKDKNLFQDKDKLKAIEGIAFKENTSNDIIRTPDRELIKYLDHLPFPDFDKLPLDKYEAPATRNIGVSAGKIAFMITARGCPWKCTFCASPSLWHSFRFRSAENIIEELCILIHKYNIKQIDFQDDTLTAIPSRLEKICDFILGNHLKVKWNGFARVSDIKDKDLLRKMYRAGCYELQFGIETSNQSILDKCNKKISVQDSIRAIRLCREVGIRTLGYFIFGLPGETRETIYETIRFARNIDLDFAAFYILLPYPGTSIYNGLVREKKINDIFVEQFVNDYSVFKNPVISVCELSIQELDDLRYEAIRKFYFSCKFISKTIKHTLKSPRNIFSIMQLLKEFSYFLPKIIFR